MIEIRQLRQLLAVAEHGSFHRAAKSVHLSQPALTKSIQRLERFYGVSLFDRLPRSVVPTPFGRLVIDRRAGVAAEFDTIKREVDLRRDLSTGELSVGTGPYVAECILGPAVGRLVARHPGLRVRVTVVEPGTNYWSGLAEALGRGTIELLVIDVSEALRDKELQVIELPHESIVCFCRPDHPLLRRRRITRADLRAYPIVAPTLPSWAAEWFAGIAPASSHRAKDLSRVQAIECSYYPMIKQIVRSSLGISGATRLMIAEELRQGTLAILPVAAPEIWTHAGIITRKALTLSPAAEALVAEIRAVFVTPDLGPSLGATPARGIGAATV